MKKNIFQLFIISISVGILSGCNMLQRISEIGQEPTLSHVQNPVERANYKKISMPMPSPKEIISNNSSLWPAGSKSFFQDLRANKVGDIITVLININDSADLQNTTTQKRESDLELNKATFLGLGTSLLPFLNGLNPAKPADLEGKNNTTGTGTIKRNENVRLQVAAVVTHILPNGNMVIDGRQETRVNYEVRELQVAGVVQPQDITSRNTVNLEDIAEARVSYGGRGSISDMQQPRYGHQLIDIILPF